jgi:hypothetical protein
MTPNSNSLPLTDALSMASAISGELAAMSVTLPTDESQLNAFQHREFSHAP